MKCGRKFTDAIIMIIMWTYKTRQHDQLKSVWQKCYQSGISQIIERTGFIYTYRIYTDMRAHTQGDMLQFVHNFHTLQTFYVPHQFLEANLKRAVGHHEVRTHNIYISNALSECGVHCVAAKIFDKVSTQTSHLLQSARFHYYTHMLAGWPCG